MFLNTILAYFVQSIALRVLFILHPGLYVGLISGLAFVFGFWDPFKNFFFSPIYLHKTKHILAEILVQSKRALFHFCSLDITSQAQKSVGPHAAMQACHPKRGEKLSKKFKVKEILKKQNKKKKNEQRKQLTRHN
jgi:hypothetical protein